VKTRIQSLSSLATLAIAIGMISWGSALHAQNAPTQTPDRQTQQPNATPDTPQQPQTPPDAQTPDSSQTPPTQSPSQQKPGASPDSQTSGTADPGSPTGGATQTFSGTVSKQGDKYVLKDDSGHTYDIDHQEEVKKFDGKRVRVQGTLDATNNKIMVK